MEQKAYLVQCAARGRQQQFYKAVRSYILFRLGLPEAIAEEDLYELSIMSLKLQLHGTGGEDASALEARLRKFDCHQTEAAVQKKVLLMMHLERALGVAPAPGGSIHTLRAFAKYLYRQIREECL